MNDRLPYGYDYAVYTINDGRCSVITSIGQRRLHNTKGNRGYTDQDPINSDRGPFGLRHDYERPLFCVIEWNANSKSADVVHEIGLEEPGWFCIICCFVLGKEEDTGRDSTVRCATEGNE